jgi:RHS repeat-associated protein
LRFQGKLFDPETGLYYNNARYYDPVAGRFISEDPVGVAGGVNQYVYAGNDPINGSDVSGTDPDTGGCGNCVEIILDTTSTDNSGSVLQDFFKSLDSLNHTAFLCGSYYLERCTAILGAQRGLSATNRTGIIGKDKNGNDIVVNCASLGKAAFRILFMSPTSGINIGDDNRYADPTV